MSDYSIPFSSPFLKFLLIQDCDNNKGQWLFYTLLKQMSNNIIHVLCFESICGLKHNENLKLHSMFKGIRNWDKDIYSESLISLVERIKQEDKPIIAFDSLNLLITEFGVCESYQLIHNLINVYNLKVICILHYDTLPQKIVKMFQLLAHVKYFFDDNPVTHSFTSTIMKSGSLLMKTEEVIFYENGKWCVKEVGDKAQTHNKSVAVQPSIPISTHRIELNEKEKKSRDENLVLPYLRDEQISSQSLTSSITSKIVYTLDEDDDFDEDDPDDDLDI